MIIRGQGKSARTARRLRPKLVVICIALFLVLSCPLSFLIGVCFNRWGYVESGYALVRSIPRRVRSLLDPPKVPTLHVGMKFKHFLRIQKKRDEAIRAGVLLASADDFVPATVKLGRQTLAVDMRLKGDWLDHLRGDKWSYRVRVKGDDRLLGMRVFSLQHPRVRNWEAEWLYQQHLRAEAVLSLRYGFVRVVLNGEDKGIYNLEEHFSKELLESQNRREGVIVKFDETDLWKRRARGGPDALHDTRSYDYKVQTPVVFQKGKVRRSEMLRAARDAAVQLLQAFVDDRLPASRVFKVPELARFLAITALWDAEHALIWHNVRFYYDPLAARLEPVGFDGNAFKEIRPGVCLFRRPWTRQALRDPALAEATVKALTRLSPPSYLVGLKGSLADGWQRTTAVLQLEWPARNTRVWSQVRGKQHEIRQILGQAPIVTARAAPGPASTHAPGGATYRVQVGNILRLPVELVGFRRGDGPIIPPPHKSPDRVLLPARYDSGHPIRYVDFALGVTDPANQPDRVVCRVLGTDREQVVLIRAFGFRMPADGPRPQAPPLAELLKQHPFLKTTRHPDVLKVRKGTWDVRADLIMPTGVSLEAGPGTTLRFDTGAVMVCAGPLALRGTLKSPVRLEPRAEHWAGVLVLNAPLSHWAHVTVRATTGVNRRGWQTTGGVTFYNSPVHLVGCRFLDHAGEDALNVVGTRVECRGTEFARTQSDAFDGDFIEGTFHDCVFHDIGGDAIDVSASQVLVHRTVIRDVSDKGLSAGEESHLVVGSVLVERAHMGVVSKDLSNVVVHDLTVRDVQVGLAAYVKKQEYGPASIQASDTTLEAVRTRSLVQRFSLVTLNGLRMPETDVDVKALYVDDSS